MLGSFVWESINDCLVIKLYDSLGYVATISHSLKAIMSEMAEARKFQMKNN